MPVVTGLIAGLLFGVGLVLSGMTLPAKVIGFLDVAGDWDPSLAFVMGGAIAVYAPLYRFVVTRTVPLYAQAFAVVSHRHLDAPLLLGAAIFGVGWGLGGFCPGPGIVSAGAGGMVGVTFALSMVAGMGLFELYRTVRDRSSAPARSEIPAQQIDRQL